MASIKVSDIENRIHTLSQRDPVRNKNIINKLKRIVNRIKNNSND